MMRSSGRVVGVQVLIIRALALGLVSLLLIEAFVLRNNEEDHHHRTKYATTRTMPMTTAYATYNKSATRPAEQVKGLKDGSKLEDLNFVASKRKVPRGPDPIHNRRAGNSRRPPGRA